MYCREAVGVCVCVMCGDGANDCVLQSGSRGVCVSCGDGANDCVLQRGSRGVCVSCVAMEPMTVR